MTTPRENLLKVFRHERPEWIPIGGHVHPYNQPSREGMDAALAEALGEVRWGGEATIIFSRYLGLDIMDWYTTPVRITRRNVTVDDKYDGNKTTRTWHTPKGDLTETIVVCHDDTGAVSSNWTEHLVKAPEDIDALAAIFEDEVIEADADAFERTRRRRELIGDDGILMGPMAGTPLGMMYRVYSGVATLAYLWADAPGALHDLFAVMERNYLRQMSIAAQSELDAIVGVDDTSTTTISPAMFEACNLALTDERARFAHEHGKLYFHHSCGHIRDLLPLYRETMMDAVHAFTQPPMGNVTIKEGRRLLGDRITIMAGLKQLAGPMDDRKAVRASIEQMLRDAEPLENLTLGISGYPNRTMEQTRFVLDCARDFIRKRK